MKKSDIKIGDIVTRNVKDAFMNVEFKVIDRVGSVDAIEGCQGMVWCERSHYINPADLEKATEEDEAEFWARENIFVEGTAALMSIAEPEYI